MIGLGVGLGIPLVLALISTAVLVTMLRNQKALRAQDSGANNQAAQPQWQQPFSAAVPGPDREGYKHGGHQMSELDNQQMRYEVPAPGS